MLGVVLAGELLSRLSPPSDWPGCAPSVYSSDAVDTQQLRDMGYSSVGWLDSLLLGVNHLYIKGNNLGPEASTNFGFDPEGLVTTLNAVFPMFVGLHVGRASMLLDIKSLFVHWILLGTFLSVLGLSVTAWIAFNKRLWSPSYSLFTTGTGILMYALLFFLCDAKRSAASISGKLGRFATNVLKPFQWLGSNCILFFVLSECCGVLSWFLQTVTWDSKGSKENLVSWFHDKFLWHSCGLGRNCSPPGACGPVEAVYTTVGLIFWIVLCGLLHRKRIFWKI